MPVEELRELLPSFSGIRARVHEPMAAHLPLRLGGHAEVYVVVDEIEALAPLLAAVRSEKVRWRVLWPFEDWLVRDGPLHGVVLRPGKAFEHFERLEDGYVRLGGATPWAALRRLGPEGWWSELALWPGCPGGTWSDPVVRRVLHSHVRSLTYFKGRSATTEEPGEELPPLTPSTLLHHVDLGPGRRLRIRLRRTGPHPVGTLFADHEEHPASGDLRRARLLGSRLKAWRLSEVEPGVVIQLGGGTCHDLQMFAKGLSAQAERVRGHALSLRPPLVGEERRR